MERKQEGLNLTGFRSWTPCRHERKRQIEGGGEGVHLRGD